MIPIFRNAGSYIGYNCFVNKGTQSIMRFIHREHLFIMLGYYLILGK